MSQKIDDVLDVLVRIRNEYRADKSQPLTRLRIRVVREIARHRSVDYQTIADAYIRRLAPDIELTPAFDQLVESWLIAGSRSLQQILERHALDRDDRTRIREFFA